MPVIGITICAHKKVQKNTEKNTFSTQNDPKMTLFDPFWTLSDHLLDPYFMYPYISIALRWDYDI